MARFVLLPALSLLSLSMAACATTPAPAQPKADQARVAAHFAEADRDRNGQLSLAEFTALHDKKMHRPDRPHAQMMKRFHRADDNRNGQISREEAREDMPRLDRFFDQIDTNRDGQVSKEEMRQFRPPMPPR